MDVRTASLSDTLRVSRTFCCSECARVDVHIAHVHGRDMHPWNTLVDNVARATMREALPTSALPESLILSLGYDRGREWEWLLYASQEGVVAFPP
eukprot:3610190-Pyramimonas_sp.AAC.1